MGSQQPHEVAAAREETEAEGMMPLVQGYSQQMAESGLEPRQAAFRAALSHPLLLSEGLISKCL